MMLSILEPIKLRVPSTNELATPGDVTVNLLCFVSESIVVGVWSALRAVLYDSGSGSGSVFFFLNTRNLKKNEQIRKILDMHSRQFWFWFWDEFWMALHKFLARTKYI